MTSIDTRVVTVIDEAHGEGWSVYNADCVDFARQMPDCSVDFSIYSPPFANLYTYSDSARDMGNCVDDQEFLEQYRFLIEQLHRVLRPGRLVAVHCKDLVNYAGRDGMAGLRDFPGELIRLHQAAGFAWHSKVTIWKDPVIEQQRTKAHGLLYKQLRADSSFSRMGLPEYVLMFRKWSATDGDAELVQPVRHTKETFPLPQWQKWASPVWMDIDQTNVLNVQQAREDRDEKHMCLARGSLVLTSTGFVPIESVQRGDLVLTHRGRWRPVVETRCNGLRRVIRMRAQGVPGLRCTDDHPVWMRRGKGTHPRKAAMRAAPEWAKAAETLGSYVNLTLPPVVPSDLSVEDWWIVGRYLGDGHLTVRGLPLISCAVEECADLVERMGSRAGRVYRTRTAMQVYVRGLGKGRRNDPLHAMIRKCGSGAQVKQFPPEALSLDREKAKSLLDGYLSADGHRDQTGQWHASTVSKALALGLAMLIQRATGSVASVYPGRKAGSATIEGRTVRTADEWKIHISNRNESAFVADDGAWKKVRTLADDGVAEVWDLQVEEDESFTAEGCVVHNCPLQLDVIERCLVLYSNKGDVVFSPFAGIGSEGVMSLRAGRKFIGTELKGSYFLHAARNLRDAVTKQGQGVLFEAASP